MEDARIFRLVVGGCTWGTLRSIVVVAQNEAEARAMAKKEADDCTNPDYIRDEWDSCDCVSIGVPLDTKSRIICIDYIEE